MSNCVFAVAVGRTLSQKRGGVLTLKAKGARIFVKLVVNKGLVSSDIEPPSVEGAGLTFTTTLPPLELDGIQHPPLNKESDIT